MALSTCFRNRFSEVRVRRTYIDDLRYLQAPTFTTYIALISLLTYRSCRLSSTFVKLAPGHAISIWVAQWSHQLSKVCGFDPRLGLSNGFPEVRIRRPFIDHLRYLHTLAFTTYITVSQESKIITIKGHHKETTNLSRESTQTFFKLSRAVFFKNTQKNLPPKDRNEFKNFTYVSTKSNLVIFFEAF